MINFDDVYKIGRISKSHGLKGEVVFEFDDDVFDRTDSDYLICNVDGILVPFFIEEYRFRSDSSVLMKFEDIDSPDEAAQILGSEVYFERKSALAEDEDMTDTEGEEYSLYYFIGFTVLSDNQAIGIIETVDDSTQNWLFILDNGTYIPANGDFIIDIDQQQRTITMDLPEGLLELNN